MGDLMDPGMGMVMMTVVVVMVVVEGFLLPPVNQHPDVGSGDSMAVGLLRPDRNAGKPQAV